MAVMLAQGSYPPASRQCTRPPDAPCRGPLSCGPDALWRALKWCSAAT